MRAVDLRLNAIVDPERAGGRDLAELARLCAEGGATLVQLRDKASETRAMVEAARAIKRRWRRSPCRSSSTTASTWRWPPKPTACISAPTTWRSKTRARCSAATRSSACRSRSVAEAEAAPVELIDYVGSGGVYATLSKQQKSAPIGPAGLARIIAALRARAPKLPVAGIAGIDAGNAAEVIGAGADGIAVISALSLAPDPAAAARGLRAHRRRDAGEAGHVMGAAIAVTIAGSDLGGGAGIQADLKTFAALGVYGACVITALTAQNTKGVFAIHDVPADFIAAQIDAVFSDLDVGAVKIGMLGNAAAIEAVAAGLARHRARNVVLDPVMAASSGEKLLRADAIDGLRKLIRSCERADAEPGRSGGAARFAAGARRSRDARASGKAARASAPARC